ncbi:hypothetical protein BRADI_1g21632v3 [Brachypodium distachyon]|uniref:Uncharacterized protein n=1 Tax=Brachypodium distachyon TaxID=15368 RepID=A0A2K2DKH8_BRADI|nr:hypothetical protein BRADI_1g21632v3 [Brachypodium distachyon]
MCFHLKLLNDIRGFCSLIFYEAIVSCLFAEVVTQNQHAVSTMFLGQIATCSKFVSFSTTHEILVGLFIIAFHGFLLLFVVHNSMYGYVVSGNLQHRTIFSYC